METETTASDLFYLIYVSAATVPIDDVELRQIFESSRRKNSAVDITGMLIYRGGLFMQMLEGPRREVLRAYGRITDDSRHNNLLVVLDGTTSKRVFPHWAMAGPPDESELSLDRDLMPVIHKMRNQSAEDSDHATAVLKAFRALRYRMPDDVSA